MTKIWEVFCGCQNPFSAILKLKKKKKKKVSMATKFEGAPAGNLKKNTFFCGFS